MKAQAAKQTQKTARAERAAPAAAALSVVPLTTSETYLQRQSCACGGICPRCQPQERKIQPKLVVGPQGDAFEQEADRVAAQVMRMPDIESAGDIARADTKVQRACRSCEPENDSVSERIQRHSVSPDPGSPAPAEVEHEIGASALTAGGRVLTASTRQFFESRFNRDLSAVRWHAGDDANAYCAQLNAHAFTYGNHIWLGNGLSSTPSFVMAHELAHVVQQTQPAVLTNEPQNAATARSPLQASGGASVQRLPFWVPLGGGKAKADNMSGSELHKELLGAVNGKNKVETEAPVPNAIRTAVGLGLQGYADLYRASSRVGVYFNPRQGLEVGDTAGNERHTHPAKPNKAGKGAKPIVNKVGAIEDIDKGPKDIELGELKPAAKTELEKGHTQLGNYEKGFKDAAELTNQWSETRKYKDPSAKKPKWMLNSVTRLPEKDVKVAPQHDPADTTTGADRLLALADIDENSPKKGQKESESKYSVKKVYTPKIYLGEEIKGKLFLEPFGQGLWMYYARPNNFEKALDLPKLKADKELMVVARKVQEEVIGNLKRGPEQIKFFPLGGRIPHGLTHAAPRQVQRKPKGAKLKDHFDQKAFDKWSKLQSQLGKEVRGTDKTKTSQQTFKKLEFLELASKAENALDTKVKPKGKGFPKAADLKLKIETGTGKTKAVKDTSYDRVYGWLERWTSAPYKALGKFRQIFGAGFVGAVNKFETIKGKISAKVKEFFDKRSKVKKAATAVVQAVGRALKQVIDLIVPQTMHLLTEAIKNGIQKKLDALFEDTFVETSIDKFEEWAKQIQNYEKLAEKKIDEVKEQFVKDFKWVDDILDELTWFWRTVKAGRALLKCRRPPFLGCIGLFRDAAKDHELQCVLCIPWVQKQIAGKVMSVPWFKNMPADLASAILKVLHDLVPEKAEILRDVFSEKITNQMPNVEELTPECKVKCDGFIGFEGGGPGGKEVTKKDAEAAEEIAKFSEEMSKEEIEEMLHEAERRGMIDKPFDKKKAEELRKELKENRERRKAEGAKPEEKKAEEGKKQPGEEQKQEGKKGDEQKKAEEGKQQPQPQPQPQPKPEKKKQPPKKKKDPAKPKPPPRKPGDWDPRGRNAPPKEGAGKKEGEQGPKIECTWDPSQVYVFAHFWDTATSNYRTSGGLSGSGNVYLLPVPGISDECAAHLDIVNNFGFQPCKRGKFRAPTVTVEVKFNGKELFKETDEAPKVHSQFDIVPRWGERFTLPPITQTGDLEVTLTMFDKDTGTKSEFNGKMTVQIITSGPNICCNCIS